jgi:hypothetical protein
MTGTLGLPHHLAWVKLSLWFWFLWLFLVTSFSGSATSFPFCFLWWHDNETILMNYEMRVVMMRWVINDALLLVLPLVIVSRHGSTRAG